MGTSSAQLKAVKVWRAKAAKKKIELWLDPSIHAKLDALPGSMAAKVREAIESYLHAKAGKPVEATAPPTRPETATAPPAQPEQATTAPVEPPPAPRDTAPKAPPKPDRCELDTNDGSRCANGPKFLLRSRNGTWAWICGIHKKRLIAQRAGWEVVEVAE